LPYCSHSRSHSRPAAAVHVRQHDERKAPVARRLHHRNRRIRPVVHLDVDDFRRQIRPRDLLDNARDRIGDRLGHIEVPRVDAEVLLVGLGGLRGRDRSADAGKDGKNNEAQFHGVSPVRP
jgi:hypothetical protein